MPTWFWLLSLLSYILTASGATQCADIDIVEECPELDFTYHTNNQSIPAANISVTDVRWVSGDLYGVTISFESPSSMSKSSLSELKFTGSINYVLYSYNMKIDRIENPGNWSVTIPLKLPSSGDRVYMTTDYQIQFNWCSSGVTDESECAHWTYASSYNYITGCNNYDDYKRSETNASSFHWPKQCVKGVKAVKEEQQIYYGSLLSSVKELTRKQFGYSEDSEENHKEESHREVYDYFKAFYEKDSTRFALDLMNPFMGNKHLLSTAVEIFQTGLLEDFESFSFPSQSVVRFALSILEPQSPVLSSYLELLDTTLNVGSRKSAPSHQKISEADVVPILSSIFSRMNYIDQDPELLELAIDIVKALVLNNPAFLSHDNEQFKLMITKTLFLLRTSENKFVKKALQTFWTNLTTAKEVTVEEVSSFSKLFDQEIGSILPSSVFIGLLSNVRYSDVDLFSNTIADALSRAD